MSQAEKPNNTSRLSRRTALAGLAGVAAAGASALPAAAGVLSGENPDAELLALAGRFDPLFAEWCAHSLASDLDYFDVERLVEEKAASNQRTLLTSRQRHGVRPVMCRAMWKGGRRL
jgi:hypothetical protein